MSSEAVAALIDPILPPRHRAEFEERNDTDFAYEIEGAARFRVNVFRDRKGVGAVLRQIPINILTAAQLNLPPAVIQLGDLSKGLVLVTGPTGSGKSTTLAAIINHINETRTDHTITIEDPIEFVHPCKKSVIVHREVGDHTETFGAALKGAMRHDPDILLLGEMREMETIKLALGCASMGMLVFGTLHTNNAPKTVDRIINTFPAEEQNQVRIMLGSCLAGVVAQLLCKKIPKGRCAVHEILLAHEALPNTIRSGMIGNIKTIVSVPTDIKVNDQADVAFICSLYHVIYGWATEPNRRTFLESIKRTLKPNGRLMIVDNVAQDGHELHSEYVDHRLVEAQLHFYGFETEFFAEISPLRYVLVFKQAAPGRPGSPDR